MNVETGEIKEADKITLEEIVSDKWKELGMRPNPGCKKCHGRGYIGRNVLTNKIIMCQCVKKRPKSLLVR